MREPKTDPGAGDAKLVPLFARSRRQIGRYELIAEIARGGMGTVFLCRQTGQAGFQRLYALKLMHEHLGQDMDFVGMFLDEARIAASIHHHNVVSILDLGECKRGYFVVMEYIEGCTLGQLLRRSRARRPPELVAPIIVGLLDGLHAAHTHRGEDGEPMQLVHRDVSPANVLIGVDGVARITDFGVAKARSRITSTRPGVFKGKLAYTAPELLDHRAPIDARADVFAAGAVLWRTLTGRNLFLGDSDAATLHNIIHREIPRPSTLGLRPPDLFDPICLRALNRDPAKRYQSADEMARELRQACARHGLLGAPSDVASWIREAFAEDLAALRSAIRAATDRSGRSGDSDPSALPELPAIRAHGTGSHGTWTPSSMLEIERSEPESEIDDLEIEFVDEEEPAKKRSSLLVPGLLVAIAAIAGVALALAFSGGEDAERPTPSSAETAGAPAPPPVEPEPTAAPIADLPEPEAEAEADAESAPDEDARDGRTTGRVAPEPAQPKPAKRARLPRTRPHRARPEPQTARPKPAANTATRPAPEPEPEPEPEPDVEIEHNPYLRR